MKKRQCWRPSRRACAGFTLVEIMIVVMIIGVLLNIAAPNLVVVREKARAKGCIGNLKQIDEASQMYAVDSKLNSTATIDSIPTRLVGNHYLRSNPACPDGGTYSPGTTLQVSPTCSIPASNATNADYQANGKYYHGL